MIDEKLFIIITLLISLFLITSCKNALDFEKPSRPYTFKTYGNDKKICTVYHRGQTILFKKCEDKKLDK